MNYVFYLTNHGFGHASRNVPIIKRLAEKSLDNKFFVKSDFIRCDFLKRNLVDDLDRMFYCDDCRENGLILKEGEMRPDISKMEQIILEDFKSWNSYINREKKFLLDNKIDIVVSDIVPWALKAAKECGIPSVLIGNFNWSEMYKSYYDERIWGPYSECYKLADKAIWYEIHAKELHDYCENYECVSMISRDINDEEVERIKSSYSKEIVFVSLGASAEIEETISVKGLPYDFLTTRGIKLEGENVHVLPEDMINTPDYIAASDYVIAKGGWSTVAEIMLQRKKCALLFRGANSEDNNTRAVLEGRGQCIGLSGDELKDIGNVISKIKTLNPDSYDIYYDDTEKICNIITNVAQAKSVVI